MLLVIPMVWILVTLVFFVMRVVGDPIESRLERHGAAVGRRRRPATRPASTGRCCSQYWDYLSGIARFNFGKSITDNQPVTHLLVERGAATLELTFYALIVAFLIGIPLGRRRRPLPRPAARRRCCACSRCSATRCRCSSSACCSSCCSRSSSAGCRRPGGPAPNVETAINNVAPNTHIYLINAILYGDNSYIIDVLKHAILPAITLGC